MIEIVYTGGGRHLRERLGKWTVKPNQIWDTVLSTEQGIMSRLQREIRQDYTITRIGHQMTEAISILSLVFEWEEYEWPLSVPATIINVTDTCICINFEAAEVPENETAC